MSVSRTPAPCEPSASVAPAPAPSLETTEEISSKSWVISRILDHKVDKAGNALEYYCEFKGWEPSWEPAAALYDNKGACLCPAVLADYESFRAQHTVDPPRALQAQRVQVEADQRFQVTPEQLAGHRDFVSSKARAECTAASYAQLWNKAVVPYAVWQRLDPFNLSLADVENILVWHEMSGKASQVERLAAAMRVTYAQHPERTAGGNLPWGPLASEIVKGAKNIHAEEKDTMDRHAFPMQGIIQMSSDSVRLKYKNRQKWLRDRALIAMGMRAVRRPAELGDLRCKHLKWVDATSPRWRNDDAPPGLEAKWLSLYVWRQKNDRRAIGQWVLIEPTWSTHCSARAIYEYTSAWRIHLGEGPQADQFVFRSLNDATKRSHMSTSSINSAVKAAASAMGIKETVTGHSLRIGGATAMAAAKVPMEIIKSIGGWFSETMCQYIRAQAAPGHEVSVAMGF